MPGLTVVGHCSIDDIHYADGRELPETMGGAAAYATLGAALIGGDVTLVTVVGDDYPLDQLRSGLAAGSAVVDTTHCRVVEGRSIHYDAWYTADGSRRYDVESSELVDRLTPTPAELPLDAIAGGFVLLTPAEVWQQEALIDALAAVDCRIALDTEVHYLTDESLRRRFLTLARRVDVFLPSIEHLQLLFESTSDAVLDYASQLRELGCPTVVVKAGSRGSVVLDFATRTVLSVPALDVDLIDSTGAGDGYGGGLLSGVTQGHRLPEAACWATAAASFVVEGVGARVPAHFSPELAVERFDRVAARVESFPLPTHDLRGAAK